MRFAYLLLERKHVVLESGGGGPAIKPAQMFGMEISRPEAGAGLREVERSAIDFAGHSQDDLLLLGAGPAGSQTW